jgi:Fe-S-cluster containining protein
VISYRPRLRAHLRVEHERLHDGLLDRSHGLDGAAAALAPLLDGASEWSEIRTSLIGRGHAGEDVDDALRRLLFIHAVEGAGDAIAAKLERVLRREEALPISILEGARFECQGSGACCQGYKFGPLTDADAARLDALDLAAAFPGVAPPYVETLDGGRYLRRDGDRCIFLTGERRCGLHAAFGAGAKPSFCQVFPLESFGTVEGIRVVDRGTCATFAVSARAGLPLYDDMARVRPLLRPPVMHHPVAIVDGWEWDHGLFLRFTSAATGIVRCNHGTASETLMAIGRCLDALSVAAARCPLAPGQPDAIVTAVLGVDVASWYRPPRGEAAAAGTRALGELLREIGAAVTAAIDRGEVGTSEVRLRELVVLVEHTAGALAADVEMPAPPPPAAGAAAEVDEALRISLRQQLFGRSVLVGGLAGAGLVRIALIQLLALAGARIAAGPRPLTAADLNRGHVLATRGFQPGKLDAVLIEHEPRWRVLLDGLARAARVFAGS